MPVALEKDTDFVRWQVYEERPLTRRKRVGQVLYKAIAGHPTSEMNRSYKDELTELRQRMAVTAYRIVAGDEPVYPDIANQNWEREIGVSFITNIPDPELRKRLRIQHENAEHSTCLIGANGDGSQLYSFYSVSKGPSAAEKVAAAFQK